jgi:hypothetical protein
MRKLFTAISFGACMLTGASAQVQIQTTLPTVGLVQKNQLWNLVLANSSGNAMTGRLEMVLSDRQTSQELMTATTTEFTLSKGSLLVNINKLNPVSYNYIGIEPDKQINSLLPVGAYTACYIFVRNPNSDKREIMAEECVAFDVEPLSPPMLSFPADSAVLDINPTQFSWTPPTPSALLNRLHYEVLITEVQPSQKAAEAVLENIPFFSTDQAPNNFLSYSAAQPAFENDKWYAWQVIARDNNNYAGKSEVWVFKVKKPSTEAEKLSGLPYVHLKKNGAERTVAPNGTLRFYYFNQSADKTVSLSIEDLTEKTNAKAATSTMEIARGDNYLQKDISRMVKAEEGHVYMLSLRNSAGEKWYVMFEVKKY